MKTHKLIVKFIGRQGKPYFNTLELTVTGAYPTPPRIIGCATRTTMTIKDGKHHVQYIVNLKADTEASVSKLIGKPFKLYLKEPAKAIEPKAATGISPKHWAAMLF